MGEIGAENKSRRKNGREEQEITGKQNYDRATRGLTEVVTEEEINECNKTLFPSIYRSYNQRLRTNLSSVVLISASDFQIMLQYS